MLQYIHNERMSFMKTYKKRVDIIDMTGKRSGKLVALEYVGGKKPHGSKWRCKCDCGRECLVYGGHLRDFSRQSCGCNLTAGYITSGIKRIYLSYKGKAKKRCREFSIDYDLFGKLIFENCFYCGRAPDNELKTLKTKKLQIKYNGIDRFNPSKGYTNKNCVTCCYYCNHSKLDLKFDDWIVHLKKILNYQETKNAKR